MSYTTSEIEERIKRDFGDTVSIAKKGKVLRKFGSTDQAQTAATSVMGMIAGIFNETYVEQNLITHIASSSSADTGVNIEIEGHTSGADVAVTGVVQVAGVATLTAAANHGLAAGEWVHVRGANEAGYNGLVQVVSAASDTVFTYAVASATATPATGTVVINENAKTFVVQTVALAGQTKTALSIPLSRVSRIYVPEQTKAFDMAGTIYVAQNVTFTAGVPQTDAAVHCMIVAGQNQSEKCSTTISSSDYWIIDQMRVSCLEKTAGRFINFFIEIRKEGGVFRRYDDVAASTATTKEIHFAEGLVVPKNADVRVVAESSTNGYDGSASLSGNLAAIQ